MFKGKRVLVVLGVITLAVVGTVLVVIYRGIGRNGGLVSTTSGPANDPRGGTAKPPPPKPCHFSGLMPDGKTPIPTDQVKCSKHCSDGLPYTDLTNKPQGDMGNTVYYCCADGFDLVRDKQNEFVCAIHK